MKTEKVIILCCFILLGVYVIIVAAGYPSIPHTMSPGLFPMVASILLVCLSIAELIRTLFAYNKIAHSDESEESVLLHEAGISKILIVNVMLIALVLIMRYVNSTLGIFVFFLTYLILIAKQRIKLSILVSSVGTAAIHLFIRLLRIPL